MFPAQHTSQPTYSRHALVFGVLLYLGYLAVFFSTWYVNGVDYMRIGENAQSTRLWYALPTLFGGALLVVGISALGWWRKVLFDATQSGPVWVWVLPLAMMGIIIHNFLRVPAAQVSAELLLWATLGAIGVGFGEEMITRGSMVVGLRSHCNERQVWFISTLLFSALHVPNVYFGLPLEAMPVQVVLTFIMGSGFYAMRRMSGTLLLPMVLHGLWDSSLFLSVATGVTPSAIQFAVYPVAIVCVIAVLRRGAQTHRPAS